MTSAKPRVLIVDDNPTNLAAFATVLERDYAVQTTSSGRQALELSLQEEFALILLDVRMPVMDGFETAVALRGRNKTREIPIVFLSAHDLPVDQLKRAYVAGVTDFIPSPVDEELLRFKAAAYVRLYRRNETMKDQLRRLENLIHALRAEAGSRASSDAALKAKVDEFEGLIEALQRNLLELPTTSGAS